MKTNRAFKGLIERNFFVPIVMSFLMVCSTSAVTPPALASTSVGDQKVSQLVPVTPVPIQPPVPVVEPGKELIPPAPVTPPPSSDQPITPAPGGQQPVNPGTPPAPPAPVTPPTPQQDLIGQIRKALGSNANNMTKLANAKDAQGNDFYRVILKSGNRDSIVYLDKQFKHVKGRDISRIAKLRWKNISLAGSSTTPSMRPWQIERQEVVKTIFSGVNLPQNEPACPANLSDKKAACAGLNFTFTENGKDHKVTLGMYSSLKRINYDPWVAIPKGAKRREWIDIEARDLYSFDDGPAAVDELKRIFGNGTVLTVDKEWPDGISFVRDEKKYSGTVYTFHWLGFDPNTHEKTGGYAYHIDIGEV